MRNIVKYSKIYSGTIPEFIDGDVFKTKISLNGTVNGAVNDGVKLSVTEEAVLACLKADNVLSAIKIAEKIGKDKRTVERTIKSLKEKGCIQRVGSDKTGSWKILR